MLAAIAVALRLKFSLFQLGTQRGTRRRRPSAFAANLSELRTRHDPPSPDTFPSFLNEVGQQIDTDVTIVNGAMSKNCCVATNPLCGKPFRSTWIRIALRLLRRCYAFQKIRNL